MDETLLVDDVKAAVAHALKIDPKLVGGTTAAGELQQWDSLGHLIVVSELEARFGTRFSMEEILSARTVTDFADLLAKRHLSR